MNNQMKWINFLDEETNIWRDKWKKKSFATYREDMEITATTKKTQTETKTISNNKESLFVYLLFVNSNKIKRHIFIFVSILVQNAAPH